MRGRRGGRREREREREERERELYVSTNGTYPFSAARCIGVLLISFLESILTLARSNI